MFPKKYLILSLSIAFLFGFSGFLHECVHYTVAYITGADQIQLTYSKVYSSYPYQKEFREIVKKNWDEKAKKVKANFPEKERYLYLIKAMKYRALIMSASAPLTVFLFL